MHHARCTRVAAEGCALACVTSTSSSWRCRRSSLAGGGCEASGVGGAVGVVLMVLLGVALGVFDRKVLCNGSYFREKSPLGVVSAVAANGDARTGVTGGAVRVGVGTDCLLSGLLGLARFTWGATASAGAVL